MVHLSMMEGIVRTDMAMSERRLQEANTLADDASAVNAFGERCL